MESKEESKAFQPLVCVVDFHHARGPEVERWFGVAEGQDPMSDNDWSLLPFLALPDGSHSFDEELSYFTLRKGKPDHPLSSFFGIACTRQIDAQELLHKPDDVTRSSVQKAVVVIIDNPHLFSKIREQLSAVTKAWFAQKDFRDCTVIEQLHESVVATCSEQTTETDQYVGLSLREVIHTYRFLTLVLFKACLLQPKMLFFSTHCERMCLLQFTLISLLPGLIGHLEDCADPKLNNYESTVSTPVSLRTSDRASLLRYMGLPLQIFGKGSLFGPYTPLQQLELLTDKGTHSYIAGSTNSLLLQHKDRYSDILVDLDEKTISIFSPSLRAALLLTAADRRWMDALTQSVEETWDPENPARPSTHGYVGSEEAIRFQFEEYTVALISSVKYRQFVKKNGSDPKGVLAEGSDDPASDFASNWVEAWMQTDNFRIFNASTDPNLFDVVDPRHPYAGGLTFEDVQRRVARGVADLHLDQKLSDGRDAISKNFALGQQRMTMAFNKVKSDIEVMRENQRKRAEERKLASESTAGSDGTAAADASQTQAQAPAQSASAKASAILSSWSAWATEKRNNSSWSRSATTTGATAGAAGGAAATGTATAPSSEPTATKPVSSSAEKASAPDAAASANEAHETTEQKKDSS